MPNKKFYLDKNKLIELRKKKSETDVARELGCHTGTISWNLRDVDQETKKSFIYERVHK